MISHGIYCSASRCSIVLAFFPSRPTSEETCPIVDTSTHNSGTVRQTKSTLAFCATTNGLNVHAYMQVRSPHTCRYGDDLVSPLSLPMQVHGKADMNTLTEHSLLQVHIRQSRSLSAGIRQSRHVLHIPTAKGFWAPCIQLESTCTLLLPKES